MSVVETERMRLLVRYADTWDRIIVIYLNIYIYICVCVCMCVCVCVCGWVGVYAGSNCI